jgi:hypothetical protein
MYNDKQHCHDQELNDISMHYSDMVQINMDRASKRNDKYQD